MGLIGGALRIVGDILRAIVRLLSLAFWLFGFGALALIGWLLARGQDGATQLLGRVWFDLHVDSLNLAQAIIQRRLHPALWDPGVVTLLGWPAWLGLLAAGGGAMIIAAILWRMTRPRRQRA